MMRIGMLTLVGCTCALLVPAAPAEEATSVFQIGSMPEQVMGTTIVVSNLRRSIDFYTRVLGMKEFEIPGVPRPVIDDPMAVGKTFLNFSGSPADPILTLGKQKDLVPTEDSAKLTVVGVKVLDVRAALNRAKAAGARVLLETTGFKGALVCIVVDPDGYGVEIVEAPSVGASVRTEAASSTTTRE